ncbi:MAG: tetratricopeptide repeat protein [Chthoniobacteraceae bacterium]|jgi:tetratricopeptide (TPR) repeat protein
MNLSRGWLSLGKPRRLARACLLAFSFAAPAVPSCLASWDEQPNTENALEADVLPGNAHPADPDLLLTPGDAAKADAYANFSVAITADDSADSDTALADYQKALALDPGYTELAVKVAFELARRGDPSAGIEVLKDSIKASPGASLAYIYLSQLYLNYLNKPDVGLKYAQQALAMDPSNLKSYMAVYEIYLGLNEPGKAAAVLDRAAKSESTDPQFWLTLGETLFKPYADSATGIPAPAADQIAAVYRKAVALDGTNPTTLENAADFLALTRHPDEAVPLYLEAIRLSPANPPDGDDTLTNVRYNLANCYYTLDKTAEAISTLRDLIKADPLRYDPYELLCDLYEKNNQIDQALATCQQMMLLRPDSFQNCIRQAALLMKLGKMDAAIQTLTDARTKFPTEAQVTYSLGLALSEAKRYPEALGIFEQAEQEASIGQTEMLDAQFYFAYGAAAEQSGQVEKAAELMKKSIDLDPANASDAYNYLGYMWADRGMKLDEAAGYIKKALQMQPDNAAYIDSMGWYYYKKGDFARAIEILKKAAKLIQPEDAVVDEHVGDAYAAAGDTNQAIDYWQRASALDKDNKEIAVKIAGARQKLAREGTPAHNTP